MWIASSLCTPHFCLRHYRSFDVVHVQYPSIGFRWSLAPHILGWMRVGSKTLVTLHEHSLLPTVQRLSTFLFRRTANCVLFTTEFERTAYLRGLGNFQGGERVIPIGSNVPVHPAAAVKRGQVVYFGQIKPDKGIEDFLELSRLGIQQNKLYRFVVIGSIPARYTGYYAALRAQSPSSVDWLTDLPFPDTAEQLASSLAAYLPFPDGASYRRGSMLAAFANGLPVIAPRGTATTQELTEVLLCANSPVDALAHLDQLTEAPEKADAISRQIRCFGQRFSWPEIARGHKALYMELLDGESLGTGPVANAQI